MRETSDERPPVTDTIVSSWLTELRAIVEYMQEHRLTNPEQTLAMRKLQEAAFWLLESVKR